MGNSVNYKNLEDGYVFIAIQDGFKKQWVHLDEEDDVTYIIDNPTGSKIHTLFAKLSSWSATKLHEKGIQDDDVFVNRKLWFDKAELEFRIEDEGTKEVIFASNYITLISEDNRVKTLVFDKIPISECLQPYRIL